MSRSRAQILNGGETVASPHSIGSAPSPTIRQRLEHRKEYLSLAGIYALRRRDKSLSSLAQSLLRSGIVVIPKAFTATQTRKFTESLPTRDECRYSPEGTNTLFYPNAHTIPGFADFFNSPLITDVMHEVLGPRANRYRAAAQYRDTVGRTAAFDQFFHVDSWRPRYKAFLYLSRVTSESGPFTYIPNTHHGLWRDSLDNEIWRHFRPGADSYIHDDISAYVGCFWPHQVKDLCARQHAIPLEVIGDAGTLILFDARGLHAIRPLEVAPRIILYSYWIEGDQHV
jgi:hypothetical protein